MLTHDEKQESIKAVQNHETDSGSSPVQISLLTKQIHKLNEHLGINKKDKHSRKALLALVERRRKHISYLKRRDTKKYEETIQAVGLRK